MRREALVGMALAGSLLLAGMTTVSAQDATPAADNVPDPSECTVDQRSVDEIAALLTTPAAATPEEVAGTPEAVALPEGEPTGQEVVSAVEATLREAIACQNAGDIRAAFALYTDDYFREVFPTFGPQPQDDLDFLATPAVESIDVKLRQALLEVRDVRILSDGRVGAVVVTDNPATPPEGQETSFAVFEENDGRWLIDDIMYPDLVATPTP